MSRAVRRRISVGLSSNRAAHGRSWTARRSRSVIPESVMQKIVAPTGRKTVLQAGRKTVAPAGRRTGLSQVVTSYTFRHSFATHLLADGYDTGTAHNSWAWRTLTIGHTDVRKMMVYKHDLNRGG